MAIIADILAGDTRTRITDRGLAYATIANVSKTTKEAGDPERVVPLTYKGLGIEYIPLGKLIEFRKREEKEANGGDYKKLRHNYLAAVEEHVQRISGVPVGSADREELDRVFEAQMETDLKDLKTELGFAKTDAWLSKDVMTLILAGGALAAAASAASFQMPEAIAGGGGMVLLGGLLSRKNKLAKARHEILRKHPTAYLFQLQS